MSGKRTAKRAAAIVACSLLASPLCAQSPMTRPRPRALTTAPPAGALLAVRDEDTGELRPATPRDAARLRGRAPLAATLPPLVVETRPDGSLEDGCERAPDAAR